MPRYPASVSRAVIHLEDAGYSPTTTTFSEQGFYLVDFRVDMAADHVTATSSMVFAHDGTLEYVTIRLPEFTSPPEEGHETLVALLTETSPPSPVFTWLAPIERDTQAYQPHVRLCLGDRTTPLDDIVRFIVRLDRSAATYSKN